MTPYYADNWLEVWLGDCRAALAAMPAESVQTVVTSPPYWGLRDYGTAAWVGGDPEHEHEGRTLRTVDSKSPKQRTNVGSLAVRSGDCECGAVRVDDQLGLEASPAEYKPVQLMRHLIRLVTPPGGTVLDPFLGSGTTAIAAELEGFPWIGIERDPESVAISEARLNGTQRGLGLDLPA